MKKSNKNLADEIVVSLADVMNMSPFPTEQRLAVSSSQKLEYKHVILLQ